MKNSYLTRVLKVLLFAGIFVSGTTANAQWRIKTLSWNIESGESSLNQISTYLSDLEGYDIIGLSEVDPAWAANLVSAAEGGEGAKGNSIANFSYVIGSSGFDTRLMIIWDTDRFELVGSAVELDNLNSATLSHRSPLYITLRRRVDHTSFIFMVNHLARGDEALRNAQAQGLKSWAMEQTLPIIAAGDYNFDYDLDEGTGNAAFNIMLDPVSVTEDQVTTPVTVWEWLKPTKMIKSQSSQSYNSILDFVFVANMPGNWVYSSEILLTQIPFVDDTTHADHRPIDATFFVNPPAEVENTLLSNP
ncbi:MAG: hypothetical protein MI748_14690 [Opitutales bacterium]|nr:hypothetical protein [Opitutales bacterium]